MKSVLHSVLQSVIAAAISIVLLGTSVPARAAPQAEGSSPPAKPPLEDSNGQPCFLRREWNGAWKVTQDARTIYIEVSGQVYRLDLGSSYKILRDPFAVLINKGASDTVCGGPGFDLLVSNQAGIEQSPVVKRMTRLTPAEVASLPKELRP